VYDVVVPYEEGRPLSNPSVICEKMFKVVNVKNTSNKDINFIHIVFKRLDFFYTINILEIRFN